MKSIIVLVVVIALSATQAAHAHKRPSALVLASQVLFDYEEYSKTTNIKSLIYDPFAGRLTYTSPKSVADELYRMSNFKVAALINKVLGKRKDETKVPEFKDALLRPCVRYLARLGPIMDELEEAVKQAMGEDYIAQLPMAIGKICKILASEDIASKYV